MTANKRTSHLLGALLLGSVAFLAWPAHAEDIDIYGSTSGGGSSNLVIILDNAAAASANSTYSCPTDGWPDSDKTFKPNDPTANFGFEQCGLYGALAGLSTMLANQQVPGQPATSLPLKLGLMYFPGNGDGGQFVKPGNAKSPDDLIEMDDAGITDFKARVKLLSLANDKSNNNQFSQTLQETFAFYNGLKGLSGTQYTSPANPDSCGRNYVVYITLATNNQKPQDGGKAAANALSATSGSYTELTLPPYKQSFSPFASAKQNGNYQSDPSDEWSRFMYTGKGSNGTQYNPVTAYTIILYDGSNPEYEQLMQNVAVQSNSTPLFVKLGDTKGLTDAIGRVMRQVMATNSVFAAPVLPVSANTQGTYANQVFMGMFRPDGHGLPRWVGNLKQYQFGANVDDISNPVLFLADATGTAALSSAGTGFLDPSALSFWTSKNTGTLPDKAGGFWKNAAVLQSAADGYDSVDGQVVERGGVSQQIRLARLQDAINTAASPATYASKRNIFTCLGTSCTGGAALSSMKFDAANNAITDTLLVTGGMSGVTRENLINWTRGADVAAKVVNSNAGGESSAPPDATITVRGSVHGDVLHSRPAVVNYGGQYGTVVFYGANDGLFRAINGNQPNNKNDATRPYGNCTMSSDCAIATQDSSGIAITVPPGGELWSFIPSEFYGKLMRIYQNSVQLTLGQPASSTMQPKTYFFDGSPGVYQNGGTAYLFIPARRGGRLLYALDVSDPTKPKFMWKIDSTTPGFAELGETWSQSKVAMVKGHTGPVLIFGAGYDTNQDNDPPTPADSMGRGILIVDATTGKLLWSATGGGAGTSCTGNPCTLAGMTYSIPGDITLIDRDADGYIDRLYAGDTGGNLWRVDLRPEPIGSVTPDGVSQWQASLFAALGGTGSPRRKFFFPPDVVVTKTFDAVVAVTGDREHPLSGSPADDVKNRFYMIKDTNVGNDGSGWTPVRDDTGTTVDVKPDGLFNATSTPYDNSGSGYYVTLEGEGEKGVNAPTSFGGSVYFGTNRPLTNNPLTCKVDLGEARGYTVNFLSGAKVWNHFDGGGLPPSPVVGIVAIELNDGTKMQQPFIIGGGGGQAADGTSALGVERAKIPIPTAKRRTFWYQATDR
ncbi:MAG: pilus assembly protein PilY [Burkholderiaceae bacterium]|nr:MAG: pilus assembly protein PilY [Burkholderiaceae bacterium]